MPVAGEKNEFGQTYFPGLGWSGNAGQGGYTGPSPGSFAQQGFAGVGGVPNPANMGDGATRPTSTPNPVGMGPAPIESPYVGKGGGLTSPRTPPQAVTNSVYPYSGGGAPMQPTTKEGDGGAMPSVTNPLSRGAPSTYNMGQSNAGRYRPANEPNEYGGQGQYQSDGASRWMAGAGQDMIPIGDPSTWNFGNGPRDPNTLISRGLITRNAQGQWVTPRYNIRGNFRNESQFGGPVHNGAYALIGALAAGGMGLGALGAEGAGAGAFSGATAGVEGGVTGGAGLAATGGGAAGIGAGAGVGVTGGSAAIPWGSAASAFIDPMTGEPFEGGYTDTPTPGGPEGGGPPPPEGGTPPGPTPEGGGPPPSGGSPEGDPFAGGETEVTGGTSGGSLLNNPLTRGLAGPLIQGLTGGGGSGSNGGNGADRGDDSGGFNWGNLLQGGLNLANDNQNLHSFWNMVENLLNRGDYNSAYRPGYLASLQESYTNPDKFLAPYKEGDERDIENRRRKLGAAGFNISGNELGDLTQLQSELRYKHLNDVRNDMRSSITMGHPEQMSAAAMHNLPYLFQARANRNAAANGVFGGAFNSLVNGVTGAVKGAVQSWVNSMGSSGEWIDPPPEVQSALQDAADRSGQSVEDYIHGLQEATINNGANMNINISDDPTGRYGSTGGDEEDWSWLTDWLETK